MKRPLIRVALPILALAMGALGFYHVDRTSQSEPLAVPPANPPPVGFDSAVAGSGVVEAQTENIAIGTALPGLVLEVYVPVDRVGTFVRAGTPLFRIDDRHLKAQLAVAEAQLASSQAALAKLKLEPRPEELPPSLAKVKAAEAKTARLKDEYDRAGRLVRSGAVAQEDFIGRRLGYEAAVQEEAQAEAEDRLLRAGAWKPDIAIAQAAVEEARAKVEQLKTEIGRAVVTAPVDGDVLQVNVRPGERIGELDTRPLMVLGDTRVLDVRIDIDERDLPRYRPGAPAVAYPRGATSRALRLRFVRVEPLAVAKKSLTGKDTELVDTRVLQAIYAIERSTPRVYVGQQVDVFIRR